LNFFTIFRYNETVWLELKKPVPVPINFTASIEVETVFKDFGDNKYYFDISRGDLNGKHDTFEKISFHNKKTIIGSSYEKRNYRFDCYIIKSVAYAQEGIDF